MRSSRRFEKLLAMDCNSAVLCQSLEKTKEKTTVRSIAVARKSAI